MGEQEQKELELYTNARLYWWAAVMLIGIASWLGIWGVCKLVGGWWL